MDYCLCFGFKTQNEVSEEELVKKESWLDDERNTDSL